MKGYNAELVEALNHVSTVVEKMSRSYSRIGQLYGATGGAGLFEVFSAMGEAFEKTTDTCKQLQGMVRENFDKFFRYYRKELDSTEDLLLEWTDCKTQYVKSYKRVYEKKEMLYTTKQIDKWELKEDCKYPLEALLKSKETAFGEMLPAESKELAKHKEIYGYYCNKVGEEYQRLCTKNDVEFREHLIKVAEMNSDLFERVLFANTSSLYRQ